MSRDGAKARRVEARRAVPSMGWRWVLPPLAAGLALRLWLLGRNAGLTMDSLSYVTLAEDIRARAHATASSVHYGYPLLVALATAFMPGREWAGRIVSLLAGLALIAITWRIARERLGPRGASLAAGLVALQPLLAVYSGVIMTESTFQALSYGALLLVARGRPAWSGAMAGAAFAVRFEGVLIAAGAALFGARRWKAAAVLLLAFGVIAAAYVGFDRWERGSGAVSPKISELHPPVPDWFAYEIKIPSADSAATAPRPESWTPANFVHFYPRTLGHHLANLIDAWPWPLMSLSIVGLLLARGVLLAPLLVLAALPLALVALDPRLIGIQIPSLAIAAVFGANELIERLVKPRASARVARFAMPACVVLGLTGMALAWTGPIGHLALNFDDGPMAEMRAAGDWIRSRGHVPARVMDRKGYVPFFADARLAYLPDNDLDAIIDWARKTGVDYLVVEEYVVQMFRPQLAPLIADPTYCERDHRLRPAFRIRTAPGTGVAVFEVVKDGGAK